MSFNRTLAVVLALAGSARRSRGAAAGSGAAERRHPRPGVRAGVAPRQADAALVVVGGREQRKTLFGTGDALVIRGGARRASRPATNSSSAASSTTGTPSTQPGVYPISISTAGAVADRRGAGRLLDCRRHLRLRRHHRRGLSRALPARRSCPTAQVGTTPDFAHPGRLILGAERRQIGGAGRLHGARSRQRSRPAARASS